MEDEFHKCEVDQMIKIWIGGAILAAIIGSAIYSLLF